MMKNKYNSYGNNDRQTRMKMFMTMMRAMMGNNMNDNNYNYRSNNPTDRFGDMFNSRSKRAVDPSLDLGDRLVEKLQEKQHMMEEKIGNMTCVFKEMGCLNHKNELDLQGMKDEMNKYTMPVWFQKGMKKSSTPATRWPPTCPPRLRKMLWSLERTLALLMWLRSRLFGSAVQ